MVQHASLEKVKSDWNQTWFIDRIRGTFIHAVKSHIIDMLKVIQGHIVR